MPVLQVLALRDVEFVQPSVSHTGPVDLAIKERKSQCARTSYAQRTEKPTKCRQNISVRAGSTGANAHIWSIAAA